MNPLDFAPPNSSGKESPSNKILDLQHDIATKPSNLARNTSGPRKGFQKVEPTTTVREQDPSAPNCSHLKPPHSNHCS